MDGWVERKINSTTNCFLLFFKDAISIFSVKYTLLSGIVH